jgi:hypothetical protein
MWSVKTYTTLLDDTTQLKTTAIDQYRLSQNTTWALLFAIFLLILMTYVYQRPNNAAVGTNP